MGSSQQQERPGEESHWSLQKDCSPADTSISAPQKPLWKSDMQSDRLISLCCLGLFTCGNLLQQPQKTSTVGARHCVCSMYVPTTPHHSPAQGFRACPSFMDGGTRIRDVRKFFLHP